MSFKSVDRLPMIEWVDWWDKTILRWKEEGLPKNIDDAFEIREYFGLDRYRQCRIRPTKSTFPKVEYGKGIVFDMNSYKNIKKHLFLDYPFDEKLIEKWSVQQKQGNMVVQITLDGFFWFPRTLFGIEEHLYAFYDMPQVMHKINNDLLEYNLQVLDKFCNICTSDFVTFAEDMSYNHGPMISKKIFSEFIAPYYRKIIQKLKEKNIFIFIDSDGNIDDLIPWFLEIGIDGFLPLERQAGEDIVKLRKLYPKIRLIGGYNKTVMCKGENAMRNEFEQIFPAMKQGGYIPSVDHQTPPDVSFENYKIYLRLLKEYCGR